MVLSKFKVNAFFITLFFIIVFTLSTNGSVAQQTNKNKKLKFLYDTARVLYRSSNYPEAKKYFTKILEIKKTIANDTTPKYFKVYNWLGLTYKKQGYLKKAGEYYKLALENTNNSYMQSLINNNIANVYVAIGDYNRALIYYQNGLRIFEKSTSDDKYKSIVINYHNQATILSKMHKHNQAIIKLLKSIEISKQNNLPIRGETYVSLGLMHTRQDSITKANLYYNKAMQFYKKRKDNTLKAFAYINYSGFLSRTKEYQKSESLYKKAFKILRTSFNEKHPYLILCFKDFSSLYYRMGNYKQALHYYQQALIRKVYSFNDTCIYTNPTNALPDLDLINILKYKSLSFKKLANHENKIKNLKAALNTLELTVGYIEKLRTGYLYENTKLELASKEHSTYLSIIDIAYTLYKTLGNPHYAHIAFKYAELSKYSVLRELQNEEMSRSIAGIPDSIWHTETKLKRQISSIRMQIVPETRLDNPDKSKLENYNKQLFASMQKLDNLIQHLETQYPNYYKQKYSNKTISIDSLQKSITKNDVAIEYTLTKDKLYSFVITKDTFLLDKQTADSSFLAKLDFYTKVLHRPHSSDYYKYRNAAYNVYSKLIHPFDSLLANKNLLIIPDDKLSLISFDALIDKPYSSEDIPDYRTESYLIRKHAISYAYSATLYANSLTKQPKKHLKFMGIAPSYEYSRDSLRHLPLGLKNVKQIAALTLGKSLTGKKATKSNFKKHYSQYDIFCFYAHGLEDTINPANSKLCLYNSMDTTNDNHLHAWEIFNLQLKAQLVVLVSCYSGAGKLYKGEGVMSIGRSFINAGSKSLIMSLWMASYEPSIKISRSFYWNLLKGMRKDKALQLAKLKYLDESISYTSPPRFWAGLNLIGNNTPLYHNFILKRIILILVSLSILIIIILRIRKFF